VANAAAYPERYAPSAGRPGRPSAGVAVVACMDARLDVYALFGLQPGEAHVIRNAGGIVTEDTLRSLALSQRLLETTEIVLVHHTSCGLLGLDDEEVARQLEADTGQRPPWRAGGFSDAEADVRASARIIAADPWVPSKQIRGFLFEVADGTLREVSL
jgi:carbonic anhydrase